MDLNGGLSHLALMLHRHSRFESAAYSATCVVGGLVFGFVGWHMYRDGADMVILALMGFLVVVFLGGALMLAALAWLSHRWARRLQSQLSQV